MIKSHTSINLFSFLAILLCLSSVLLQALSDRQMRVFRANKENRSQVNRTGVWRYIRHPNYLGEIAFWWGVYLLAASAAPVPPAAVIGPVVVTLLFIFVSIPLMEKRQILNKPDYRAYRQTAGMLLPKMRHKSAVTEETTV